MDDLEGMRDDANGHQFLSVIPALHHQAKNTHTHTHQGQQRGRRVSSSAFSHLHLRTTTGEVNVPVDETFDDGHLSLLELFLGVPTRRVRKVDRVADLDVVRERDIFDFDAGTG